MSDPVVATRALADAAGIPTATLRRWQKAGHIPRPKRGYVPLLAALRGALAAIRAEAADPAGYAAPQPAAIPDGAVPRDQLDAMLDHLVREADRLAARIPPAARKSRRGIAARAAASLAADVELALRRIRATRKGAVLLAETNSGSRG